MRVACVAIPSFAVAIELRRAPELAGQPDHRLRPQLGDRRVAGGAQLPDRTAAAAGEGAVHQGDIGANKEYFKRMALVPFTWAIKDVIKHRVVAMNALAVLRANVQ